MLEGVAWAHRSPGYRALGFEFGVRTTDPELGAFLEELFQPFRIAGSPSRLYSFLSAPDREGDRYAVYFEGQYVVTTRYASTALRHFLWDVNHRVVGETRDHLLVHASAAEHEGGCLLFPAPMDAGKTTLVAGLAQAGLRYVTDEAAAFHLPSLTVTPYPKPLHLDTGSWSLLAELRPQVPEAVRPYLRGQWYVPAGRLGAGALAPPSAPRFVIAPRYVPDAATELLPLTRAEAVVLLYDQAFNAEAVGRRRALEVLAAVVRRCACYRLMVSDLDRACQLVLGLLQGRPQP
ncbi:MAG TPA: hypothetical protein VNO34_03475 [Actinomycetota bacterium]|nr:hypothetical protein [Actinomycetota bacterium]